MARPEGVEGKMAKISNADLDQLTSEVLPERTALGVGMIAMGLAGSAVGTTESVPVVGGVVSTGLDTVGPLAS
jgi:hypothetical protein